MRRIIAIAVLVSLVLTSCTKKSERNFENRDATIIVSAAASTKDVVEALVQEFEGGEKVKVNAGPSNGLASQILAGAPADLFLSASEEWADEVQKAGQAAEMVRLLTNRLVIVVPQGNPAGVREPGDLLKEGVKRVALAGEAVPAGKYADQALAKLGMLPVLEAAGKIVRGQDVRGTLAYVERGEVEAGVVYATDVAATKGVESVYEFDAGTHDEIVYVLVLLKHGAERLGVRELYQFFQSPRADEVYSTFGFVRIHAK